MSTQQKIIETPFSAPDLEQLYQDWSLAEVLDPPAKPTIVVAGAYQGKVIRLVAEMFPDYTNIIGFEPARWAYLRAIENTRTLRNIHLVNKGLYAGHGVHDLPMGEYNTDACSVLSADREMGTGMFEDALQLLFGVHIDLLILNVEGYEYKLLPYLAETRLLDNIQQLAVQFHTKYETVDADHTIATLDSIFSRAANDYPKWVLWCRE